jgi:hypothetical protein
LLAVISQPTVAKIERFVKDSCELFSGCCTSG